MGGKDGDKKKKGPSAEQVAEAEAIVSRYKAACKAHGADPIKSFVTSITDEVANPEWKPPITKFTFDSPVGGVPGMRSLLEALAGDKNIKNLHFWGIDEIDEHCVELFSTLLTVDKPWSKFTPVAALELSSCKHAMTGEGPYFLGKYLRHNPTVRWLTLDHNGMGDAACVQLCEALKGGVQPNLRRLSLRYNGLTAEACKAVGELLEEEKCMMTHLELHGNVIGCFGLKVLGDALRKNKSLLDLGVGDNRIDNYEDRGTELGDQAIADLTDFVGALRENNTLQVLNLKDNHISTEAVEEIFLDTITEKVQHRGFILGADISRELCTKITQVILPKNRGDKVKGKKKK